MQICNTNEFFKNIAYLYLVNYSNTSFVLEYLLRRPTEEAIEDIDNDSDTLKIRTLPEDVSGSSSQRRDKNGIYWRHKVSCSIIPQSRDNFSILTSYQNKRHIVILKTHNQRSFVLGNSQQPLLSYIKELNSKNNQGTTGFLLSLEGNTTLGPLIVEDEDLYKHVLLAQWLAENL